MLGNSNSCLKLRENAPGRTNWKGVQSLLEKLWFYHLSQETRAGLGILGRWMSASRVHLESRQPADSDAVCVCQAWAPVRSEGSGILGCSEGTGAHWRNDPPCVSCWPQPGGVLAAIDYHPSIPGACREITFASWGSSRLWQMALHQFCGCCKHYIMYIWLTTSVGSTHVDSISCGRKDLKKICICIEYEQIYYYYFPKSTITAEYILFTLY